MQGLSCFKVFLLLEQENIDVLYLQETWVAESAPPPNIDRYTLTEYHRTTSARGRVAIYNHKKFLMEATVGNEYGFHTKIILPNSQGTFVANVYLPSTTSLAKCHIQEINTTIQVLDHLQP